MRSVKSICVLVVSLFALSCSSRTMAGKYVCDLASEAGRWTRQ